MTLFSWTLYILTVGEVLRCFFTSSLEVVPAEDETVRVKGWRMKNTVLTQSSVLLAIVSSTSARRILCALWRSGARGWTRSRRARGCGPSHNPKYSRIERRRFRTTQQRGEMGGRRAVDEVARAHCRGSPAHRGALGAH